MPRLYRPRAYDSYRFDKGPRPPPQTSGGAGLKILLLRLSGPAHWTGRKDGATTQPLALALARNCGRVSRFHSSVVGFGVADRGGWALSLGLVAVGSHRDRRVGVGHPPGPTLRPWVGGRVGTTQPLRVRTRHGTTAPFWTPMHPDWLRCSSLTDSRYARSSCLASRAPRHPVRHTYSVTGPNVPVPVPAPSLAAHRTEAMCLRGFKS